MTEAQALQMIQLLTWVNDNLRLIGWAALILAGSALFHVGRVMFR